MGFKDKIENNITLFFLGVLLTGFLAGIGTYKAILEIAKLEVVPENIINQRSDNSQLAGIIERIIQDLTNEDRDIEEGSKYALKKIGMPATEQLIKTLKEGNKNQREKAAQCLGEMQVVESVDALISALEDDEPYVSREAARALGEIGDKDKSVKALRHALTDTQNSPLTREGAAYALGMMRAVEAKDDLIKALQDDNPNVNAGAAAAMGDLPVPEAADTLLVLLEKSNSPNVRGEAAYALGKIKYIKAVDPLIKALNDHNSRVRADAASALGLIGDARAKGPLQNALKDNDWFVRSNAEMALRKIKGG